MTSRDAVPMEVSCILRARIASIWPRTAMSALPMAAVSTSSSRSASVAMPCSRASRMAASSTAGSGASGSMTQ